MRKILLALFLSVIITIVLASAYVFYPLVSMLLSQASNRPDTGGVAAVAGGGSLPGLIWLLLSETVIFMIVFALLSRKRKN